MAKWLVPALRCLTFPVAVNRQRFLVALCVLSLYIVVFCFVNGFSTAKYDLSVSNRTAECIDNASTFQGRIGCVSKEILKTHQKLVILSALEFGASVLFLVIGKIKKLVFWVLPS